MNDFYFTLNLPHPTGQMLRGKGLFDHCEGSQGEQHLLEKWLSSWNKKITSFPAVAVGFVRYDGSFWFGIPNRCQFITYRQYLNSSVEKHLPTDACNTNCRSTPFPKQKLLDPIPCKISSSLDYVQYIHAVKRAQHYINAGDIYQVNICRIISGECHLQPDSLAKRLFRISAAPYFSHIHIHQTDIISASPELFAEIQHNTITTQPIKGTRRRAAEPEVDAQLALELSQCPKELAELIMITDLERNDLGRICTYGSVRVIELAVQKVFPHVRHLVSTITGNLLPGISPVEALFSCLPGGSITGAPKIRAMQIISEIEPVARGLYCGVIGYFDLTQPAARFSIAIRTIELRDGQFRFGVGSGITSDSIPPREWEETNWKAAPLLQALGFQSEAVVSSETGANS